MVGYAPSGRHNAVGRSKLVAALLLCAFFFPLVAGTLNLPINVQTSDYASRTFVDMQRAVLEKVCGLQDQSQGWAVGRCSF